MLKLEHIKQLAINYIHTIKWWNTFRDFWEKVYKMNSYTTPW